MTQTNIKTRLQALSPEKQRLLALRLGMNNNNTQSQQLSLSAFVTANNDVDESDLRKHLRDNLPQYMIPTHINILDEIPRTPNGKVDRNALLNYVPAPTLAPLIEQHSDAPDEIESQLMSIWEDLLGMEIFSVEDNFFELGGYSLLAIRMLGQIKETFGKELPASIIMESPTIAQLAEQIRDDKVDFSAQTIFTLQPEGDLPPLYCFQVHKFGIITYRYIAQALGTKRPVYGVAVPQDMDNPPTTVEGLAEIFVESLLQKQPEAPYYLCGMSIAGLIAYEMGRQLHQRGITDVQVILFDTYGPDYPQMISTSDALKQRAGLHMQTILGSHDNKAWYIKELLWRNWYRADFQGRRIINRYLHRFGLQPIPEREEDIIDIPQDEVRLFAGKEVHGEMIMLLDLVEGYFASPKPYAGDVLLYRSTLQPLRASYDETLAWDKFVSGELKVQHVRGNHSGILRDPFVQDLAKVVNQDLDQLEQTSS